MSRPATSVAPTAFPPPAAGIPDTPAAWAQDPFGRFQLRYWDGTRWTAHVSSWWRQQLNPDFYFDG
ncbi:MAG: DUF2510 domain-containing protein [Ilumatobacteraceae bacterium]